MQRLLLPTTLRLALDLEQLDAVQQALAVYTQTAETLNPILTQRCLMKKLTDSAYQLALSDRPYLNVRAPNLFGKRAGKSSILMLCNGVSG